MRLGGKKLDRLSYVGDGRSASDFSRKVLMTLICENTGEEAIIPVAITICNKYCFIDLKCIFAYSALYEVKPENIGFFDLEGVKFLVFRYA